jgi:hypothetical protein
MRMAPRLGGAATKQTVSPASTKETRARALSTSSPRGGQRLARYSPHVHVGPSEPPGGRSEARCRQQFCPARGSARPWWLPLPLRAWLAAAARSALARQMHGGAWLSRPRSGQLIRAFRPLQRGPRRSRSRERRRTWLLVSGNGGLPGMSGLQREAPAPGDRRGSRFALQQKTPRRGDGALLGLLQGGEICISIYVDRWEVGEPFRAAERRRWEVGDAIWAAPGPTGKSCQPFIVLSVAILESEYEHMCDLCVTRVTEPLPGVVNTGDTPHGQWSYPLLRAF